MPGLEFSVDAGPLLAMAQKSPAALLALNREIHGFGLLALSVIHRRVAQNTPRFTGLAANSMQIDPPRPGGIQAGAILWEGRVVNPLPYIATLEFGRRPGQPGPPLAPIRRWVELKVRRGAMTVKGVAPRSKGKPHSLNARERASIGRVAWLVRRKIHLRGTKGRFMFRKGLKASERRIGQLVKTLGANAAKIVAQAAAGQGV